MALFSGTDAARFSDRAAGAKHVVGVVGVVHFPRCFVLRRLYVPSPWWKAAKEMTRAREKALEESGLSHGHITEART